MDILVYKIAKNATAEMTTRNSYLLRQENAIIPVLVAKTKCVVLHGDYLSMDHRYDSAYFCKNKTVEFKKICAVKNNPYCNCTYEINLEEDMAHIIWSLRISYYVILWTKNIFLID